MLLCYISGPCPYVPLANPRFFASIDDPSKIQHCKPGFQFVDPPCTCVVVGPSKYPISLIYINELSQQVITTAACNSDGVRVALDVSDTCDDDCNNRWADTFYA